MDDSTVPAVGGPLYVTPVPNIAGDRTVVDDSCSSIAGAKTVVYDPGGIGCSGNLSGVESKVVSALGVAGNSMPEHVSISSSLLRVPGLFFWLLGGETSSSSLRHSANLPFGMD